MNKLLLLIGLFLTSNISAQINSYVQLNANSLKCMLNSNGELFSDLGNFAPGFSVENSQNLNTIFSNRMVFAGLSPNGELVMTKPHGSYNLSSGPLGVLPGTEFGIGTTTQAQSDVWSQIFVITKDEIDEFKNYHACQADPNCDATINFPGYQIPSIITNWPAHGDTSLHEPLYLASFYDANNDGVYNAIDGDYPCIKGDVYAWFVVNNYLTAPSVTTFNAGIEVQIEVYQFQEEGALSNTVFVGYEVINRSITPLADFYFSNYTDFDLGNPLDDYMATLPDLNAYFSYNGDNYDETSAYGTGFLDHLPAQGVVCLNQDLSGAGYADIDAYNPVEYYNIMWGYHTDGSVKYFPGTQISTPFTFPYTTTSPFQWTEENSDGNGMINSPGDRRMQGATGPYLLDIGERIEIDFAFVYARTENAGLGKEASINKLITDINEVQNFYDTELSSCEGPYLEVADIHDGEYSIYPNPASDFIEINPPHSGPYKFTLLDASGRMVLNGSATNNAQVDLSVLTPGIYYLQLNGGMKSPLKIVKQ